MKKLSKESKKPRKTEFIEEWLKRANDDELNIKSVLKHRDGTPANVCFLSQQASEKRLKALLIFHAGRFPKVHDLGRLLSLIEPFETGIKKKFEKEAVLLTDYYVATRYPADISIEDITWEIAEEAYKASLKIKKFVLKKV